MKKTGRNRLCHCGSNKKYKVCCESRDMAAASAQAPTISVSRELGLAIAHHQGGRWEQADALYRHILSVMPDHPDALHLSGLIAIQQGNNAIAVTRIARAIQLQPAVADYHYHLGLILQTEMQWDGAAACYRQALAIKPDYLQAYPNLGAVLQKLGRLEEAIDCYRQALAIKPDYAEAHCNMGLALQAQGRMDAAMACYRQALALKPEYAEACNNLGFAWQTQGKMVEAISCYRQALALKPDYAEAYCNLGIALSDIDGRESMACYRQALSIRPDYADARFNLALELLRQGNFLEGWPHYEARFDRRKSVRTTIAPDLSCPQWAGEDLTDKTIVVWPEQGMGDEIQSVRYIPLLKALGAVRITLVCKEPLLALFRTVSGADAVIAQSAASQLERHDFWTFQMSLPLHFASRLENLPARLPYLAADPGKIEYWSGHLPGGGFKVGLVWKGSITHPNDARRSLPALSVLAPLWAVPGIRFVSLQKGQGEAEATSAPTDQPLIALGSLIQDFSDTAAIIAQLDLIICIDTAVAHLAGALGKSCWVLLPANGCDWRWLEDRAETPWYPGVMRLFRQTDPTSWNTTVAQIAGALQAIRPEI